MSRWIRKKSQAQVNPYVTTPLCLVREDAIVGASHACEAYAQREPRKAAALGIGISAEQQARGAIVVNGKREVSLPNSEKHGTVDGQRQ